MGTEILGNILEKSNSFTLYMSSGKIWSFKTDDISDFEYLDGVIAIRFRRNKMMAIMDSEIEAVSLDLKEEEKSE